MAVNSRLHGERLVVTIEDDGAGLDELARQLVLGRGVRQDERVPGSGLGLAIVRDLAGLYGGSSPWTGFLTAASPHVSSYRGNWLMHTPRET